MNQPRVIVIDGHDGAGKTTLASGLAKMLGVIHIRPYAGSVGQQFIQAIELRDFGRANKLALQAVAYALAKDDASIVVCDRHWMTAFSVLPEIYWSDWQPLPPTALCWADLETTLARLECRREQDGPQYDHKHFLATYWKLGQTFEAHVLRTDKLTVEESLEDLRSWAADLIQ